MVASGLKGITDRILASWKVQVGRELERSSGAGSHGTGSLDERSYQPAQSRLENLQAWGLNHSPEEAVPVNSYF